MKYLIVGLGNIGSDYEGTRHNIGFMVLDALAKEAGVSFALDKQALKTEMKVKGRTLVLIKPTTYMNLSGKAVRYWMQQEKIPVENVLVITDDIALPFEKMRMKMKGSHGGHNGLRNIEETLTTQVYTRLRMGVGDDFSKGKQVDFVLGKFSAEEQKNLPFYIDKAAQACIAFTTIGVERTMNQFNTK